MYGATDAFLQELNIRYSCELEVGDVSRLNLAKILKSRRVASVELSELGALITDADAYLGQIKDLRHHITHRGGIPMQHYFNGASSLVHPRTGREIQIDTIALLEEWLGRLTSLLEKFRAGMAEA
jgi:hypothetical protein